MTKIGIFLLQIYTNLSALENKIYTKIFHYLLIIQ
jgi:hypothetical protein